MCEDQAKNSGCQSTTGFNRQDSKLGELPPIPGQQQKQRTYYEPDQSAATPPAQVLPPRLPTKPASQATSTLPREFKPPPSPTHTLKCSNHVPGAGNNTYDEVINVDEQTDQDKHLYLTVTPQISPVCDTNSRLQKIEQRQTELCKEFCKFKNDITTEIFSLKEMTRKLTKLVEDSSSNFQNTLETIQFKLLENSDHLGKQILDVRRDIVTVARKQSTTLPKPHSCVYTHTLEWEVVNVDGLIKCLKESSSETYSIHQNGYNIHGSLSCTKDGRLWLKIFGEFPPSSKSSSQKNTKFECTVHIVNKTGKLPEWVVGRVTGDFSNSSEWMVGDISASEIKKRGYIAKGGNVNLKFITEFYD